VPKVFSRQTLGVFEEASASIPLRQLVRAFESAAIRPGKDPGGPDGARRVQFRCHIAGVDQHDPQQLGRLCDALGALIDEVATSKQDFLVKAAERDGFIFANGAFRAADTSQASFAITRGEDLKLIEERGRLLLLLANQHPIDAIGGAKELVGSVCRTVLQLIGAPAPAKKADLVTIARSALEALEPGPSGLDDAQLSAFVARAVDGKSKRLAARHARLAVGAAVAFAGFVAETYADRA
jgi:hypothetical protein